MWNRYLLFFFFTVYGVAQVPQLSDKAEISVLTCAADPAVLYYSFGHTAIRVQDPTKGIDVVYNYGTFNFDQPNFYLNFTKGRLLYTLTRRSFSQFLYAYELENRWVKQQVLNLDPQEINRLFQFFEWNFLPENRDYLYDPLFENCSTVVGKVLADTFGEGILYNDPYQEFEALGLPFDSSPTFREMVRSQLKTNSWGGFGIDLAFGAVVDRRASLREQLFLPYYAMAHLRVADKDVVPLLKKEEIILDFPEKEFNAPFLMSPLFVLIILFLAVLWFTYREFKKGIRNRRLDFWVYFVSGLAGVFLVFLWVGTDHVYTKNNWNILWLLPTNIILAFLAYRNLSESHWLAIYLKLALLLLMCTLLIWVLKIQLFSALNLIVMAILATRYLVWLRFDRAIGNESKTKSIL